jgi:putative addiction module killer protein
VIEILRYVTSNGRDVFGEWLVKLQDARAQAKVAVRIDRVASGNFGDCKPLRDGVCELRVDWGPGYRIYYAMVGKTAVLLLAGGDKRKQSSDVERAIAYLNDYKKRNRKP